MQYDKGSMLKKYVQSKLEKYVKKYVARHPDVKIIVVTGTVGKTSTKRAIADVLSSRFRIRMHEGEVAVDSELAVPLAILGITPPQDVGSIREWRSVFKTARRHIASATDTDVIIVELQIDHPNTMAIYTRYLVPDIAVVTSVSSEYIEQFGSIESVAQEELSISGFSRQVLINRDDVDGRFANLETNPNFSTYGTSGAAEYRFEQQDFAPYQGYSGVIIAPEYPSPFPVTINVVGEHSIRPVMAAVAVAAKMMLTPEEIRKGIDLIRSVPGRMQLLRGIGGTIIIDDTYTSNPSTVSAAIQVLYLFDQAPQRIALIGDMHNLGQSSQIEHEKIGALCDPNMLAWVVTVGNDTQNYLAPIARQRGCQVKCCRTAVEAGEFIRTVTEEGSVILATGSQDNVYLEEAVKILCDMTEDRELVRQSEAWMAKKNEFFSQFSEQKQL